ncbi:heavy-metal-associated domain-containing protein [Empedobacter brevis]|uniref:heavy-metal-associated domain-containing protein n=1 Tax=Empedobacter brevis TaxID=247 RepID=UPI0039B0AF3D
MKKLLAFAFVTIIGISAQAQNKNAKHDLHVKGNCEQCKERIEKAAYGVKGVKMATWDADFQNLHIVLNETKNKVDAVEDAVIAVGHDTNAKRADDKVYENLHSCCLYDRDETEGENATETSQKKEEDHTNHHH